MKWLPVILKLKWDAIALKTNKYQFQKKNCHIQISVRSVVETSVKSWKRIVQAWQGFLSSRRTFYPGTDFNMN